MRGRKRSWVELWAICLVLVACLCPKEEALEPEQLLPELPPDGFLYLEALAQRVERCVSEYGQCCVKIEQDLSELSRTEATELEEAYQLYLVGAGIKPKRAELKLVHSTNLESGKIKAWTLPGGECD